MVSIHSWLSLKSVKAYVLSVILFSLRNDNVAQICLYMHKNEMNIDSAFLWQWKLALMDKTNFNWFKCTRAIALLMHYRDLR